MVLKLTNNYFRVELLSQMSWRNVRLPYDPEQTIKGSPWSGLRAGQSHLEWFWKEWVACTVQQRRRNRTVTSHKNGGEEKREEVRRLGQ